MARSRRRNGKRSGRHARARALHPARTGSEEVPTVCERKSMRCHIRTTPRKTCHAFGTSPTPPHASISATTRLDRDGIDQQESGDERKSARVGSVGGTRLISPSWRCGAELGGGPTARGSSFGGERAAPAWPRRARACRRSRARPTPCWALRAGEERTEERDVLAGARVERRRELGQLAEERRDRVDEEPKDLAVARVEHRAERLDIGGRDGACAGAGVDQSLERVDFAAILRSAAALGGRAASRSSTASARPRRTRRRSRAML